MPFEEINNPADLAATLSLTGVYVELSDEAAGVVTQVTVRPGEPADLWILVTYRGKRSDDLFVTYSSSPDATYTTASMSEVAAFKRPPNH